MNDNSLIAEIEGYASVYNTPDLNGDIVAPGAFAKSLKERARVRMLFSHGAEMPIGRWVSFREDSYGLFVKGELLLSSPRAREVHALLAGGAIDGLSIGYQTARSARVKAGRRILEAHLWEVSIVTFPMAPEARVTRIGPPQPLAGAPIGADEAARLFKESARISSPPPLHGMRVNKRASAHPPPVPGAGARHFAEALRSAAHKLSV